MGATFWSLPWVGYELSSLSLEEGRTSQSPGRIEKKGSAQGLGRYEI